MNVASTLHQSSVNFPFARIVYICDDSERNVSDNETLNTNITKSPKTQNESPQTAAHTANNPQKNTTQIAREHCALRK